MIKGGFTLTVNRHGVHQLGVHSASSVGESVLSVRWIISSTSDGAVSESENKASISLNKRENMFASSTVPGRPSQSLKSRLSVPRIADMRPSALLLICTVGSVRATRWLTTNASTQRPVTRQASSFSVRMWRVIFGLARSRNSGANSRESPSCWSSFPNCHRPWRHVARQLARTSSGRGKVFSVHVLRRSRKSDTMMDLMEVLPGMFIRASA
ncbi:hypothetical protein EDB84DRAFT_1224228 [Lactarius hengduanensis]|nr:hypothetical protein EDB84DRAFT_1224228 [Lactarius hengduanensis]